MLEILMCFFVQINYLMKGYEYVKVSLYCLFLTIPKSVDINANRVFCIEL